MYIYHALINALSTHMIHINLNIIFYSIYIKYYKKQNKNALQTHTHMHAHTDRIGNWVLILVRMEIL